MDEIKADQLTRLIEGLAIDTADGRAGVRAILREIEEITPGTLRQMSERLALRRQGLSPLTH